MDAQLRKETVTMEQVTAHGASQAVVEGEIRCPAACGSVLHAGGMAVDAPAGLTARRSPAR
ncbi:MAG: hypothetical protein ACLT1X_13105 [Christensenellales bacterium]